VTPVGPAWEPRSFDEVGILRLAEGDETWGTVPAYARTAALQAADVEDLVAQMVDGDDPWPGDLRRRLLHPAGGAAATLVPLAPGSAVLDLGTGWSTLARALSAFGAEVTSADWVYARLRFETLMHDAPADLAVHLDLDEPLPWPDGTFDTVFVDTAEVRRLLVGRADADAVLGRVLTEARRVLTDDGVAVVGTRNRLWDLRPGVPRPGPADRRKPSAREVWAALRTPWDDGPVRAAGLRTARVIVALPRREGWRWMVPQERLGEHLRTPPPPSSRGRRAVRVAAAAGGARWLARDYYLLARKTSDGTTPRTLGEVLAGTTEQPAPATMALSDARVAVLGSRDFVKLPVSAEQQEQVVAEVRKTHDAAGTVLGAYVVGGARVERWGAVPYAVYPVVRPRRTADLAAARRALQGVLREVGGGEVALLRETVFWARLASPRGQADLTDANAQAVREHLMDTCADAVVPVGPTHGDLHAGNVLLPKAGGPQLVDWNRFESHNPLLLDGVYAAAEEFRAEHGATLADALLAFVDGEMGGAVAERARTLLGDLAPLEAAMTVFVDRAMTYGQPRRRYRPWTLPPLQRTGAALAARLTEPRERERERD
jgi:SAM-dependent methyltransferase